MKIMTGKTGAPHVTSQQFRQLVEGTVGQDSYILTSGENLEPELQTNNLLKIRSGMMSHHGNLSVVELGTYDEVTIQNGTQGMKRIDLVVNRYTRNEETGVEENNWVVIQGTPAAESPSAPAYTNGNLQDGDLVDDCPVFRVHLDGINVTEIEKLLDVVGNISDLNGNIEVIGGWAVVKHANGMCECWRRFSWNTYAGTLWKNGMYFSTSNLEGGFPVTFTEVPVVVITPNSTNSLYWIGATNVTKTSMSLTCYSMSQETFDTVSGIYMVGRWK